MINVAGIARKFLTANERSELAGQDDRCDGASLTLWTCKEAMSKATGDALSAPFASIDIDCGNRDGAQRPGCTARSWSLHAAAVPRITWRRSRSGIRVRPTPLS